MSSTEGMLSILFVAVAGSSRLFERLGGAEALYAVDRCMKRIARGVDGFRGRIVRKTRDEVTALFANADDACQAAIAMQRRIADLPPVSGVQLTIRAGFHHGPVIGEGSELQGAGVNTAECLAGLARPGQVLTSGETQARLSAALQLSTHYLEPLSVNGPSGKQVVFEVLWLPTTRPAAKAFVAPPAPAIERDLRLCLRYLGHMKVVDRIRPNVLMGRDAGCDITVRDRRASRHHAKIERRGEQFILSDLSTNGTFVTVNGESELFLKRDEFVLHGSGIIAFAASANTPEADIAEFELL